MRAHKHYTWSIFLLHAGSKQNTRLFHESLMGKSLAFCCEKFKSKVWCLDMYLWALRNFGCWFLRFKVVRECEPRTREVAEKSQCAISLHSPRVRAISLNNSRSRSACPQPIVCWRWGAIRMSIITWYIINNIFNGEGLAEILILKLAYAKNTCLFLAIWSNLSKRFLVAFLRWVTA